MKFVVCAYMFMAVGILSATLIWLRWTDYMLFVNSYIKPADFFLMVNSGDDPRKEFATIGYVAEYGFNEYLVEV